MSAYVQLARLALEHEFDERGSGDLTLVALNDTQALAARCGLLIKMDQEGVAVFVDSTRRDALDMLAADEPTPALWFRIESTSPDAMRYTRALPASSAAVLFFSGPGTDVAREDGALSFASQAVVTDADERLLNDATLSSVVTTHDREIPPIGFVRLSLADLPGPDANTPLSGVIRFAARETHWKYVTNSAEVSAAYTVSERRRPASSNAAQRDDAVTFVTANETLANGDPVITFTSQTPIALRRIPPQRFVLRDATGRITVDPLPAASPDSMQLDTTDGREGLVSNIYIHL